MVMARSSEAFRRFGVAEGPKVPGGVVATGGWNLAAPEEGERLRVHSANKRVKIEEGPGR
jgi:hypothetical protein